METKDRIKRTKEAGLLLSGLSFFLFIFSGCAQQNSHLSATFYSFEYEGENYRIRSVSGANNEMSFNELIGKSFLAKDYDQDGFIDEIFLGEMKLADAQKIYEYTLSKLTMENKLQEVSPKIKSVQDHDSQYQYEIKSFRPASSEAFNQFKMTKNGSKITPNVTLCLDLKADGTIDEIVTGAFALDKVQAAYSEVIQKGLEKSKLIKTGNMILVK